MPDGTNDRAIPIGAASRRATAPPDAVVREACASLHATEVYVRLLLNRLELAATSDLVTLDGVDASVLVRVTSAGDRLRDMADRALACIDRDTAATARAVAELAQDAAAVGDDRP